MSHLSRLLGRPSPKRAKPHDHLTKDQLWEIAQNLQSAVERAASLAQQHARAAHNTHALAERDRFYEVRDALNGVRR